MEKKETVSVDRREFFRKAGLGAGAVGVSAVGLSAAGAQAAEADAPASGAGYRKSEHVKKFYELARF